MRIIKESTGAYNVLRTESYSHTLAHVNWLFEEARKDFPDLEAKDVTVVLYGGDHYARTSGIEFPNPLGSAIPPGYSPIHQLELLLG